MTTLIRKIGKYTIELNGKIYEIEYSNVRNLLFPLDFDQHQRFLRHGRALIERTIYLIDGLFVYEDSDEWRAKFN